MLIIIGFNGIALLILKLKCVISTGTALQVESSANHLFIGWLIQNVWLTNGW